MKNKLQIKRETTGMTREELDAMKDTGSYEKIEVKE